MEKNENKELIAFAVKARENSIDKFTGFKVGAAILTKTGNVYTGCNIESSISGLGNCAERVAIQNAVANGETEFVKIAVVGGADKNEVDKTLTPCGACRQYMLDFEANMKIVCYINGIVEEFDLLPTMLPYTFDLNKIKNLDKNN